MDAIPLSMMTRFEMLTAALLSIGAYADTGYCVHPSRRKLEVKLAEIKKLAHRVLEEVSDAAPEPADRASDGGQ